MNLPDASKTIGHRFAIRWEGSVLAPETGDYEFIVRTEHSTRLWVNDLKKPLIDRWVKSGKDTEFRESIRLLGGRVYPIRLEFSKGKQGEKDGKKDPDPPPTKASIALLWKAPQQVADVIPQRFLSPGKVPETLVLETPFPPDDRSAGYERGTSISKAWDQATTDAALEVADYVTAHLGELAALNERKRRRPRGEDPRVRPQVRRAGLPPASLRRAEDRSTWIASSRRSRTRKRPSSGWCWPSSCRPRFLYHEVSGKLDAYDVACRISYGLWDSLPDQALLEAAAAGKLATRQQVAEQAQRMVADLRTRGKIREFSAPVAEGRSHGRRLQGPEAVPPVQPGDRLGPADLAGPVPGGRGLERIIGFPPPACWPTSSS